MSTLKVSNIENPSTTSGGIDIDTSGHVTVDGLAMPSTGPLSNRNMVINGAMQVAQRGTTFTGHNNGYTLDRWIFGETTTGVFDVTQSSVAPEGFSSSLKVDCTTTGTPTTTMEGFVETKLEAQNLQHLQYGTSGAQSVTLSFWVRSNKTGNYGLWVYQEDASSQYATTYTISSADTWEYKTITIPGNTATAINNDDGMGLLFRFYLQAGPTYAGTPAETWTTSLGSNRTTSLNLGDSTDNEWLLTGVQLEVGSVATPFEHRSYGDELARCQRYYITSWQCMGWFTATNQCESYGSLPVTMRAAPTATFGSGAIDEIGVAARTASGIVGSYLGKNGGRIAFTVSGANAGKAAGLSALNLANLSAEL